MFKKRFEELCAKRGESPSFVCEQLHLSNSAYSKWTDETKPRKNTLHNAANYFGVSVDYLLGNDILKEKVMTTLDDPEIVLTPDEKWFILQLRKLKKEGRTVVEGVLVDEVRNLEREKTNSEKTDAGAKSHRVG